MSFFTDRLTLNSIRVFCCCCSGLNRRFFVFALLMAPVSKSTCISVCLGYSFSIFSRRVVHLHKNSILPRDGIQASLLVPYPPAPLPSSLSFPLPCLITTLCSYLIYLLAFLLLLTSHKQQAPCGLPHRNFYSKCQNLNSSLNFL